MTAGWVGTRVPSSISGISGTARLARHFSSGDSGAVASRDWPGGPHEWDGGESLRREGWTARHAAMQAPASPAELTHAREAHASRTGEGDAPRVAQLTIQVGMVMGMERSHEQILHADGAGVGQGLRDLAIRPGDAVAEHDPRLPGLAARMALDGARAFLTLPRSLTLRDYQECLGLLREGQTFPVRAVGVDRKPVYPQAFYEESARIVARQLTVLPGTGFGALPQDVRFKALIARGAFDSLDPPAIRGAIEDAGRLLQPGGGLVFEFAHEAGRPVPAREGSRGASLGFREIAPAVERAGLGLRSLYVTFRLADDPGQPIIPTRRVLPDVDGRIDLSKADAAAMSGWNEMAAIDSLQGRPVRIDVSGLLVKEGKAKD